MRLLGIDYGDRRIGVAISDELGITARGLDVITVKGREQTLKAVEDFILRFGVDKIVIGYPIRLDGTEGVQCAKVDRFAGILAERFCIPVVKWDESLSTKEAEEIMIEAGIKRKKKRQMVDKLAAAIILQDYLRTTGKK
jgi:putative holliday junction resolvase